MKKTLFLCAFICLHTGYLVAQNSINITHNNTICRYHAKQGNQQFWGLQISSRNDETGLIPVIERIQQILDITEKKFFVVTLEDIDNAVALSPLGLLDVMAFDVDFLERVNHVCDSEWGAISIIAHEIGHHYYRHTVNRNDPLKQELEADYLSGYVLAKLGASKHAATQAMRNFASEQDSDTHPNKYDRVRVIGNGWEKGKQ